MHAMETKYICRVATRAETLNLSIHAASCSVVATRNGKGFNCFPVEGASAKEAAANVAADEQLEERGIKFPKICKCAK
jgi:hypothetical protein